MSLLPAFRISSVATPLPHRYLCSRSNPRRGSMWWMLSCINNLSAPSGYFRRSPSFCPWFSVISISLQSDFVANDSFHPKEKLQNQRFRLQLCLSRSPSCNENEIMSTCWYQLDLSGIPEKLCRYPSSIVVIWGGWTMLHSLCRVVQPSKTRSQRARPGLSGNYW